jgi:hypothetical protein
MVSKSVTMASILMPVAMVVGTGISIAAYTYSATALSIVIFVCTLLLAGIIIHVVLSQPKRRL